MTGRRSYILRADGHVMVPARIAALIERECDLSRLRVRIRGADPEASAVLEDIRVLAMEWRGSATGTEVEVKPELPPESEWMSTGEASHMLNMTDRGIRKAIASGHLQAEQVAGRWRISREDIAHYRAARTA